MECDRSRLRVAAAGAVALATTLALHRVCAVSKSYGRSGSVEKVVDKIDRLLDDEKCITADVAQERVAHIFRDYGRVHVLTCRFMCAGQSRSLQWWVGGGHHGHRMDAARRSAMLMKRRIETGGFASASVATTGVYCYNPNEDNQSNGPRDGETYLAYRSRLDGRWLQLWFSVLAHAVRDRSGLCQQQNDSIQPGAAIQLVQKDAGLSSMQIAEAHIAAVLGVPVLAFEYSRADDDRNLERNIENFVVKHALDQHSSASTVRL